MSVDTGGGPGRYWAFISYSHKDAAFGRRLHRRLEGYVLPRRLVGRSGGAALPRRLAPIFRDREELSAAQDLSAEVRAGLAQSRSLVVVCSPAAAASAWVTREVELFRALHPDRPILAAIRAGEPADSLPPALRRTNAAGETIEPLAADFRPGHDGWEHGLLKLVAGIVGVGLDEMVQRDSQRRLRRVTAVTAGALLLVLVMAVLTVFALNARSEAERQHAAAEGLVGYMSTDLREKLQGVGRLDLMRAVNQQALHYFDGEKDRLSPAAIIQRARVLQAIGSDAEVADEQRLARSNFEEAWNATHALLTDSPGDPERVFAHAQSEYWLGFDDYGRHRLEDAKKHFREYKRLADRLIAMAPGNARYLRELGYAEGDLCSAALLPPRDSGAALGYCTAALNHVLAAARANPKLNGIDADIANRQSWLGSAYRSNRDNQHALEHWLAQETILARLMKIDPLNEELRGEWIGLQRVLARIDSDEGQIDRARSRLEHAASLLDEMILLDPENKVWTRQRAKISTDLNDLTHRTGGSIQ